MGGDVPLLQNEAIFYWRQLIVERIGNYYERIDSVTLISSRPARLHYIVIPSQENLSSMFTENKNYFSFIS